jgi:hypothetical protein
MQNITVTVPYVFTLDDITATLRGIPKYQALSDFYYFRSAEQSQPLPAKMPFLASQLQFNRANQNNDFVCIAMNKPIESLKHNPESKFTRADYQQFGIECSDAQWAELTNKCTRHTDESISAPEPISATKPISAPELSKCRSALVKALSYGLPLCAILAACVAYFLSNQENTGRAK